MFTTEDNLVLDRILNVRCTCRSFTDQVPSREDISAIMNAGKAAPFAAIPSRDVVPFRYFFVMFKGDPRFPAIDRLIREQTAENLKQVKEAASSDEILQKYLPGLEARWSGVIQNGVPVFPDPPCLIVTAEWRGALRAERQSLAHLMQNMWLKATALNLDFGIISAIESMTGNQEFCDLFGLPAGLYGFHACVIGYGAKTSGASVSAGASASAGTSASNEASAPAGTSASAEASASAGQDAGTEPAGGHPSPRATTEVQWLS